MPFEMFTGVNRKPRSSEPSITVTKHGMLGVNQACREKMLANVEAVQLLYDAKARRIGVRPVPAESEYSYKLRPIKGGSGAQITAISFLRHYDIVPKKTTAYPATWDETEKIAVIKLAAK